jgi:tRNA (guanosine-2'-O-)-methyltransferase
MDAIEKMIDRYGPAAVCDALESLLTPERIARIDQVIDARLSSVAAAVEDTYDPHNAAATIRTCEALGLQQLYVIEPTGRFSAAKGVTRGAHRWLDLHSFADPRAAIDAMRAHGFAVYATLPDPGAQSIEDVSVEQPIAVVFGNEHDGVSRAVVEACDGAVTVPMFGFTESYNLSVTVGLAMSRLAARRRAYIGSLGDLPSERRARLRARWFALRIRAAVDIVDRKLAT